MENEILPPLASGVSYFSENFKALPHVVDLLLNRSQKSTAVLDDLKSDMVSVERALSQLLVKDNDVNQDLLRSSASLDSVSSELEATKAELRDLHRRLVNAIATLSGKRRDLNSLSFRKSQLESGLSVFENLSTILQAKQPQELFEAKKLCMNISDAGVRQRIDVILDEQLRNTMMDFKLLISKGGSHDVRKEDLELLSQLDPLGWEEIRNDLLLSIPPFEFIPCNSAVAKRVEWKQVKHFPSPVECNLAVSFAMELLRWARQVLQRGSHVVDFVETELVKHCTFLCRASSSSLTSERPSPPPAYMSKLFHRTAVALATPADSPQSNQRLKPSPFYLSLIANDLFPFVQENRFVKLHQVLLSLYQNDLRVCIQRETAYISQMPLNSAAEANESFFFLQNLASELNVRIFEKLSSVFQEDNYVFEEVFSGFIARFTPVLVSKKMESYSVLMQQDPLFLTLSKPSEVDEPNRQLLLEATFDYLQNLPNEEDQFSFLSNEDIPLMVVLHECFKQKATLHHLSDFALFQARYTLMRQVRELLNSGDVQALSILIRNTFFSVECWIRDGQASLLDFLFLPVVFAASTWISKTPACQDPRAIFALRSAFSSLFVEDQDVSSVFETLELCCRVKQAQTEEKRAMWRSKLAQTVFSRFFFDQPI